MSKDPYAKRWDALAKRRFKKEASKKTMDEDFIENVLDDNGLINDAELARKFLLDQWRKKDLREPPRPTHVADILSLEQLEYNVFGSFGDPFREKVLLRAEIHLSDKPPVNDDVLVEYKGIWMVFRYEGIQAMKQYVGDDQSRYIHKSTNAVVQMTFVRFL